MTGKTIIIGTRKSRLALWQSEYVGRRLEEAVPGLKVELRKIETKGDQSQTKDIPLPETGLKGLFTAELEDELVSGTIDIAVHSLKDLPTRMDAAFSLGAVCERESVWDCLVSRQGQSLADLPRGSRIGSSSIRRASQVRRLRPDLEVVAIRGNVDTRLKKLRDPANNFDAIILAEAGLRRLGLEGEITQRFGLEELVPAPAQGALGIQCRAGDKRIAGILSLITHPESELAITAERAFVDALDAGCNTPVAALVTVEGNRLSFVGRILSDDGTSCVEVRGEGTAENAVALGLAMAKEAQAQEK